MALRRVRISNLEPGRLVRCSICKTEEKTNRRIAGGMNNLGGRSCCDDCWDQVQIDDVKAVDREWGRPLTEADYQTWAR